MDYDFIDFEKMDDEEDILMPWFGAQIKCESFTAKLKLNNKSSSTKLNLCATSVLT